MPKTITTDELREVLAECPDYEPVVVALNYGTDEVVFLNLVEVKGFPIEEHVNGRTSLVLEANGPEGE